MNQTTTNRPARCIGLYEDAIAAILEKGLANKAGVDVERSESIYEYGTVVQVQTGGRIILVEIRDIEDEIV